MRKLLSVILVIVMLTGILNITAFAEGTVTLTVGEGKDFSTLREAFAEAEDKGYTNITYEIYGKHIFESAYGLPNNVYPVCATNTESVYFKGMDKDAEIFIDDPNKGYGMTGFTAHQKANVTFDSLIINHNKNDNNNVNINRLVSFWYIITGDSQTYKNCTFSGRIICDAKVAVFEDCYFPNNKAGEYALFYRGGGDNSSLTIDGCCFEGTRAIKTYTDRSDRDFISKLTVTDSTFAVTEKAAVENTQAFMSGAEIKISGNTFKNCNAVNNADEFGTTLEEIFKNNTFVIDRPGASECFKATATVYEKGGKVTESLSAGDITAKASVTNTHDLDLPVSVITAEYLVSENGFKTLLQVDKHFQVIEAGKTAEFENTLTIAETTGHMVQTIIIADDAAEPLAATVLLLPKAEKVVFMGTQKDTDDVLVSVYHINMI